MDWQAVRLTARLALVTTVILLVIGVPIAAWLASTRRRAKVLVEAVVALPLVLPPTVLGFYTLVAMGPRGPLGRLHGIVADGGLPFTFRGLVIASVLYSLPFAVQPMAIAFAGVDTSLVEASTTLGEGRVMTFIRVLAPLSVSGIVTAAILSFAHTVGEFGVVLMVGGNIAGQTRTVSVSIYDQVQALDYASAGRTSAFLLAMSFIVLAITYSFQRRATLPWARS